MKAKDFVVTIDILNVYALTNEEMIYIRGGDSEPVVLLSIPPIVI
jgi:hypothetical protein